ncbi:PepSY domain-containing protein [Oceanobacillus zhaokaii]|uniref:PepSY domain-containing protein n=1 Tax=Oceanobacillus zhaokaii TaxID=2052660 RepID=UPI00241F5DCB|nr:PepSY domain-containing protein [Oceanobacillus zhaokaii]
MNVKVEKLNDDRDDKNLSTKQNFLSEQEAIEIAEKAVNGTVTEIDFDEDDNHMFMNSN